MSPPGILILPSTTPKRGSLLSAGRLEAGAGPRARSDSPPLAAGAGTATLAVELAAAHTAPVVLVELVPIPQSLELPRVQTLARAVAVGWLFLTLGVAVGAIWTGQARAAAPDDPNLQAMALNDPKIFIAVLTWGVYSFAVFARRTMGWSGRRAAWISAVGFAIVLLNFLPVTYFVTTSHTF